jgi:hypothetical protein
VNSASDISPRAMAHDALTGRQRIGRSSDSNDFSSASPPPRKEGQWPVSVQATCEISKVAAANRPAPDRYLRVPRSRSAG